MKRSICQLVLLAMVGVVFISSPSYCSTYYYVDANGSDSNSGLDVDHALKTIPAAVTKAVAGDTIYLRGGRHFYSAKITLSKVGTSGAKYNLFAYPGDVDRVILDFSAMAYNGSNRGISLSGSYWYIKGIDIYKAGDNGMNISGSNNIIEFCAFYENQDAGLQLSGGAANNRIINCDSYYNYDPPDGGDADGFSPKLDVGTGNYFYGCRSWQNSDDGYDGYLRPSDNVTTTYVNCWAFRNGYLKDGTESGNGNGFKMGGGDNSNSANLRHNAILKNCLAFSNKAKGFDQNHDKGSMWIYNCTSFNNVGNNYSISASDPLVAGCTAIVENCINYTGSYSLASWVSKITDSWMFTFSAADFVSLDSSAAYGPRQADGSLPDITFMHLSAGSNLIDKGTDVNDDVNLPFCGSFPDLGCFEVCTSSPPSQAGSPNPANSAIDVSLSASLSWSAGSGTISHDVYFGTAATPPFIGNQAENTYAPGTLSANTIYYWRIDEKNATGTTTGAVWSFTSAPPAPDSATNPNPANLAADVNVTSILSWTAGLGATSHDVYFGVESTPPFIVNKAGNTFSAGVLASRTTYYWRIDERNAGGAVPGTLWSFTTEDTEPPLTNPMTWDAAPDAINATQVTMTATTTSDVSGVEYYFANITDPAHDSNWQDSPIYTDTDLIPNAEYYYQVIARDKSSNHNQTDWSDIEGTITFAYDCSESIVGDLDGNCQVDLLDYALLADAWANELPAADLNSDTFYDLNDIDEFAWDWLTCNRVPDTACWQ